MRFLNYLVNASSKFLNCYILGFEKNNTVKPLLTETVTANNVTEGQHSETIFTFSTASNVSFNCNNHTLGGNRCGPPPL